MIKISRTNSEHPGFQLLIGMLDETLAALNSCKGDFFRTQNKVDGIPTVVIAEFEGNYVGCGAFRPFGENGIEIKRMFVREEHRGKSIGKAILKELELWAKELGHDVAVLETSRRLGAAVNLYIQSGYAEIPNYPPYVDVSESLCFSKKLNQYTLFNSWGT